MSIEENLINRSSQTDKKSIQEELESALELIRSYEAMIIDLKLEQSNILKMFAHDISNPLQILSMSIENLEDHPAAADILPAIVRMKKASDNITGIIVAMRTLRAASLQVV